MFRSSDQYVSTVVGSETQNEAILPSFVSAVLAVKNVLLKKNLTLDIIRTKPTEIYLLDDFALKLEAPLRYVKCLGRDPIH